jgi:hypothetical protein
MISLEKQMELLADLSINYEDVLTEHGNWVEFFQYNDLAIPFCVLKYLDLADWSLDYRQRSKMEILIRKTFYDLCDSLGLDRGRKHLSVPDMFRNSPNEEIIIVPDEVLEEATEA